MTRTVLCKKLGHEALAFDSPPMPGELGKKIYEEISLEAWQMWLAHQTMLINEYRLNLLEPEARKFLIEQLKKFLFEDTAEKPPGYQPVD